MPKLQQQKKKCSLWYLQQRLKPNTEPSLHWNVFLCESQLVKPGLTAIILYYRNNLHAYLMVQKVDDCSPLPQVWER